MPRVVELRTRSRSRCGGASRSCAPGAGRGPPARTPAPALQPRRRGVEEAVVPREPAPRSPAEAPTAAPLYLGRPGRCARGGCGRAVPGRRRARGSEADGGPRPRAPCAARTMSLFFMNESGPGLNARVIHGVTEAGAGSARALSACSDGPAAGGRRRGRPRGAHYHPHSHSDEDITAHGPATSCRLAGGSGQAGGGKRRPPTLPDPPIGGHGSGCWLSTPRSRLRLGAGGTSSAWLEP